jgi:hypothetical protein
LLHGKLAEMRLPTRSIGNLQHKMQGLNLSIFIHHLKNDRVLVMLQCWGSLLMPQPPNLQSATHPRAQTLSCCVLPALDCLQERSQQFVGHNPQ